MDRAPPAPVILPKLVLLMSVFGSFHCGVFSTWKASPRNWSFHRSPIAILRKSDASRFHAPGPLMKFLPRLPNPGSPPFSAPGCAKHCVVINAPFDGLKLQIVFVNQIPLTPLPLGVGIGPGPNQFRVLLLPGAPSPAELTPNAVPLPSMGCPE